MSQSRPLGHLLEDRRQEIEAYERVPPLEDKVIFAQLGWRDALQKDR